MSKVEFVAEFHCKRNMLTDVNKSVDFLITVLANREPVSKGFLTDEPLMNNMYGLGVTQNGKDHGY